MTLPGADFYLPDGFAEIGSDEIPITSLSKQKRRILLMYGI